MIEKPDTPDEKVEQSAEPEMKPPEEMSEEELRLLADTMPGEGPGGD